MAQEEFINALKKVFPADRLLTRPAQLAPYESDALTAYRSRPMVAVIPETQEEVIEAVRLCHQYRIPFVARGSGTSLSGGSLPLKDGLLIAMNRLNRVVKIDPKQRIIVVEAGMVNLEVSKAVAPYGLYFAPDPSSQPVSTIGGNLAFNAGGAHCLKYGMMSNHVLGIKAVLPDGEVVQLGGESMENVGPDLTGLFVGCEGLFGIALEVTLRLMPKPAKYKTVLASYDNLEKGGNAVAAVVAAGLLPGAMEMMDRLAIQAAEAAVNAGYPPGAASVVIVELEGDPAQVDEEFVKLKEVMEASGATEIRIAANDAERMKFWKGRKSAFSAVGRLSPDYLVQDGVVPRSRLGEALAMIERRSKDYDVRVANVFHAGDGNLHPLILYSGSEPGALKRAKELAGEILVMCIEMGGSITGEHGIGMEKRAYLPKMFSEVDMDVMHELRNAMDPFDLANRGKMFPVGDVPDLESSGPHPLERAGIISRE